MVDGIWETDNDSPCEHFPWAKRPSTNKGADNLPLPEVDVVWVQGGHIVPGTQRIGQDVCAQGGEEKCERRKECTGAVVPLIDELEWVPKNLSVKGRSCICHYNPTKLAKVNATGITCWNVIST